MPERREVGNARTASAQLARLLLHRGQLDPTHWASSGGDPAAFLGAALTAWVARTARGAQWFDLYLTVALEVDWFLQEDLTSALCCGARYVDAWNVIGLESTLDLLEAEAGADLARAFHDLLTTALSPWLRIYDHWDAESWYECEQENRAGLDPEDLEDLPPLLEVDVPAYLKEGPRPPLEDLGPRIRALAAGPARELLADVLALHQLSAQRPIEASGELAEAFDGSPTPALLVCMRRADAVAHALDEEQEMMLNMFREPAPYLILPFDSTNPTSVHQAFDTISHGMRVLDAAHRLFVRMPGATDEAT